MSRFLKLTILAVVCSWCTISGFSQQIQYVGIPVNVFNFCSAAQVKDEWCWAASIQMIMNYYGVNIRQDQIVARSYGIDPDNGQPIDWPGSFDVITANLNNWSIDNSGRQYVVEASVSEGAPSVDFLLQELSARRPILIAYMPTPSSGHAVVITGCSYIPTPNGPTIRSIIDRDPWPSQANIQSMGRVEYPASVLGSLITATWIIRVGR
jgi:Papain-like cysteine protease AvrRpt2